MPAETSFPIDVSSQGDVTPQDIDLAREKLARVADLVEDRVLRGQLRLTMEVVEPPAPAHVRPALVEGALDVGGTVIRAHVAGSTMQEAIDLFMDRLRSRVARYVERRRDRRHAAPEPEANSAARPAYLERPAEEREIVRRKSFATAPCTPEEAVFDMDLLDHDFYLFRNADTGEENVVYRSADGSYQLIRPSGNGQAGAGDTPIPVSNQIPPRVPLADAVTALNLSNDPFLFFIDADDGAGAVLYRRYDGNYGLITLDTKA